jgi:hypothetical protein
MRFFASEVCGTARHERVASRANKRGRRSADRRVVRSRTTPTSVTACRCFGRGARHAIATLPPQCASGALASRRSTAALARFLGLAQLRAALSETERGRSALLQRAPRGPVVMPDEQGPKPPGSGVCGSARRHRTRVRLTGAPLAKGIPQERAGRLRNHRGAVVKLAASRAVEALILRNFLFFASAVCASRGRSLGHDSQDPCRVAT